MARPRKPVVVYCADRDQCGDLALVLHTRLVTARVMMATTPAELKALDGLFCIVVVRHQDEKRVPGFLGAVRPTLDTPVLQVAKSWSTAEECNSSRCIVHATPAEVIEVVKQMLSRKRGPKPLKEKNDAPRTPAQQLTDSVLALQHSR